MRDEAGERPRRGREVGEERGRAGRRGREEEGAAVRPGRDAEGGRGGEARTCSDRRSVLYHGPTVNQGYLLCRLTVRRDSLLRFFWLIRCTRSFGATRSFGSVDSHGAFGFAWFVRFARSGGLIVPIASIGLGTSVCAACSSPSYVQKSPPHPRRTHNGVIKREGALGWRGGFGKKSR